MLDGRNRLRACAALGLALEFESWTGEEAVAFVVSTNLHRVGQRAVQTRSARWPGERRSLPTQKTYRCTASDLYSHPAAEIFPLLEGAAFDSLVADIRLYGQRAPIVLDAAGRVLDGRNRLRACAALGITPSVETWTGDDAVAFVVSANLHRRHLTESQRAMIAARLATLPDGVKKKDQVRKFADLDKSAPSQPVSQKEAADMLKVGERSVRRARTVIEAGEMPVSRAGCMSVGNRTVAGRATTGQSVRWTTGDMTP